MAPPKGTFPQRLQCAQKVFGFPINKPTFHTPYSQQYPMSNSGGMTHKMYSNPSCFGIFHNRCFLINARNCVLGVPAFYAAMFVIFDCHPYQMMKFHFDFVFQQEMPQWAEDYWQDLLRWQSWNKPGKMMKHTMGGTVSIPGSERLVQEL